MFNVRCSPQYTDINHQPFGATAKQTKWVAVFAYGGRACLMGPFIVALPEPQPHGY